MKENGENKITMENKKKIYISGPITDNPEYGRQFTEKYLELEKDYIVLSPLMIKASLSWKEYMKIDLAMISVCDCVYMLKGWENSRGAKIEEMFARMQKKEVIYEE